MPVDNDEIVKIADLARLHFSDTELESFASQFQLILDYVEKLREADISGIDPTSQIPSVTESGSRLREDEPSTSLLVEEALSNAPDAGQDHFKVPKVI